MLRKDGKYVLVTDCQSVPRHDALTCIERQNITRADHAAGNPAVIYVFVHDPQKQYADVRDRVSTHDDEWRASFDDDDDDTPTATAQLKVAADTEDASAALVGGP